MGFDWLAPKNYKRHYICLKCQKGFKRPSEEDMKDVHSSNLSSLMEKYYQANNREDILQYISKAYKKNKVACPNCKGEMHQVHYNFEVPPQRDHKSWKRLQKTTTSKMATHFETYIQWHRMAIKKPDALSVKQELLLQNLEKLVNASQKD